MDPAALWQVTRAAVKTPLDGRRPSPRPGWPKRTERQGHSGRGPGCSLRLFALALISLLAGPAFASDLLVLVRGSEEDPIVQRIGHELRLLGLRVEQQDHATALPRVGATGPVLDVGPEGVTIHPAPDDPTGDLFVPRGPGDDPNVVALAAVELVRARILHQPPARAAAPPPRTKDSPRRFPRRWLYGELLTVIRRYESSLTRLEPRLGIGVTGFPGAAPKVGRAWQLAATLDVTFGPGVPLDDKRISARWTNTEARLALAARANLTEVLDLGLGVGAGGSLVTLRGTLPPRDERTVTVRLNPVVHGWGEMGYALGPDVRAALRVGAAHSFRTQSYLVRGKPVLDQGALVLDGALTIEIGVW